MKINFMKIIPLILLFSSLPLSTFAKTEIHLYDFSGSISDCQPLMQMNLKQINRSIENLDKNDRFFFFGYRSQGKPIVIAEIQMPDKRGPKNRDILLAKNHLRKQTQQSLASINERLETSGKDTDIIGALNHVLLFVGDLPNSSGEVSLHHYSDGIHTSKTGTFEVKKYRDYLHRLNKRLEQARLVKPARIDILSWHGGLCQEAMAVPLEDSALFQSELRTLWTSFLQRETQNIEIVYKLNY